MCLLLTGVGLFLTGVGLLLRDIGLVFRGVGLFLTGVGLFLMGADVMWLFNCMSSGFGLGLFLEVWYVLAAVRAACGV